MRSPERIDEIIEDLKKYWKQNPNLRLCQIVSNTAKWGGWSNEDVFYCEDDIFENGLKKLKIEKDINYD